MKKERIWVGTNGSKGIYVLEKEQDGWKVKYDGEPAFGSFLLQGPDGLILSVVEAKEYEGVPGGAVVSCRLESDGIKIVSKAKGLGVGICQLAFAPRRRMVFGASYPTGSIDVLRLETDGGLKSITRFLRSGSGPHWRQTGPHAHCCAVTEKEDILYVCDLGTDEIARYDLENLTEMESIKLPAGTGPRHIIFSNDEKYLYLVCELSKEVMVIERESGEILQIVDCNPGDKEACTLSSIRFSPDGKSLIVGCRGIEGVWKIPYLSEKELGTPEFFVTESSFPWDVLPLYEDLCAAAFTHSDCVEFGILRERKWETKETCSVKSPTYLLMEK